MSDENTVTQFEKDYDNCSIRYGDLKKQLAEDMVRFISPIREKAAGIAADSEYLKKIMEMGAEKGRASASKTLQIVREAMGLRYY